MDYIDYDRKEWQQDPAAAFAEAERRIALTAESEDPEVFTVIDLSDLTALEALPESFAGLTRLERAFLGEEHSAGSFNPLSSYRLSGVDALRRLSNLKTLSLRWTKLQDAEPLTGLTGLTRLDLARTKITDVAALSGLTGLTTLDLSETGITDVAALSGLTGLTQLDLRDTGITDVTALSGLTGLTRLDLTGTQVRDLSSLLDLPEFAEGRGEYLSIQRIPAVDPEVDRRLDMLSRLPAKRCAVEVPLYLKGEHPDFRDPPPGAVRGPALAAKLAEASDVAVAEADGVLHLENRGAPQKEAPVELGHRVAALRAHLEQLMAAETSRQVPNEFRGWLENYAKPLAAEEPIYLLLDGPMAFISGAVGDAYVTEGLDGGFVAACRMLVSMHEELRPLLLPEAEVDDLPALTEEATPERGVELADEVAEALDDPAVGEDVRDVLGAIRDILVASKEQAEKRPNLFRRGMIALGGLVGVIGAATGVHAWAVSEAGAALLSRLQPILDAILKLFGG